MQCGKRKDPTKIDKVGITSLEDDPKKPKAIERELTYAGFPKVAEVTVQPREHQ